MTTTQARLAPEPPGESAWERIHGRIISYAEETARILSAGEPGSDSPSGAAPPLRILDLACGTGRHLIEAARRGHYCTGIDQQQWKIDRARAAASALGLEVDLQSGDIRELRLDPVFDLVVCLYAFSVMTTDGEVAAVMAAARGAVRPGGRFVFNVLNRLSADPSEVEASSEPGHLRSFSADEIAALLAQAGFDSSEFEFFDVADIEKLDLFVTARAPA